MAAPVDELVLPEQEFTYIAGQRDRPFHHFTGRWQAIRPRLEEMLRACGTSRPLRVVDLGSCNGYFALHAAHRHPEADVVAVEGSVGIGNGTVGVAGSTRQILATEAVKTHLRWIQRLDLQNCFLAPEVWDYLRVCELSSQRRPICDVMFLLSVVHHIDNVSVQQYTNAGLSHLNGSLDMLGKLLRLAPRHFVELPNQPWLSHLYEAYGTQRSILQAAAKASGYEWNFKGPIYSADWFGMRELWVLECATELPSVDVETCPFPLLYRGEEHADPPDDALAGLGALGVYDDALGLGDYSNLGATHAADSTFDIADAAFGSAGGGGHPAGPSSAIGGSMVAQQYRGNMIDPGLMCLFGESCAPVEDRIGQALHAAPTELLVAHLNLRDAVAEAEALLKELHASDGVHVGRPMPAHTGPVHPQQAMMINTGPVPTHRR